MRTRATLVLAIAILLNASASDSVLQASLSADLNVSANDARMAIVKDKDVTGQVFKRLGLPNQEGMIEILPLRSKTAYLICSSFSSP
jgi:hypothetical protein